MTPWTSCYEHIQLNPQEDPTSAYLFLTLFMSRTVDQSLCLKPGTTTCLPVPCDTQRTSLLRAQIHQDVHVNSPFSSSVTAATRHVIPTSTLARTLAGHFQHQSPSAVFLKEEWTEVEKAAHGMLRLEATLLLRCLCDFPTRVANYRLPGSLTNRAEGWTDGQTDRRTGGVSTCSLLR